MEFTNLEQLNSWFRGLTAPEKKANGRLFNAEKTRMSPTKNQINAPAVGDPAEFDRIWNSEDIGSNSWADSVGKRLRANPGPAGNWGGIAMKYIHPTGYIWTFWAEIKMRDGSVFRYAHA